MTMRRVCAAVVAGVAVFTGAACSYNNPTVPSNATVQQIVLETNAATPGTSANLQVNQTLELYAIWILSTGQISGGLSTTTQFISSNPAVVQAPTNGSHDSNCSGYYPSCVSIKGLTAGTATITMTDPTNAPNLSGKFTVTVGS